MSVMATLKDIGLQQVLDALRAAIRAEGSCRAFARRHGLSAAFVSDVTLCKRVPSPRILALIGFEREVVQTITYRRKRRGKYREGTPMARQEARKRKIDSNALKGETA